MTGFSKGGVATRCFSVATHKAGLGTRQGAGPRKTSLGMHMSACTSGDVARATEPPARASMRIVRAGQ